MSLSHLKLLFYTVWGMSLVLLFVCVCVTVRKCALLEWGLWSWIPHEKIHVRIPAGIKAARKKAASTNHLLNLKYTLKVGERAGSRRGNRPYVVLGLAIGCSLSGLTTVGVVSNGGCFQSFGDLLPQVEKGNFLSYKVCTRTSGSLSPVGCVVRDSNLNAKCQMHYNESRGYLGESWKRRARVLPLWLLIR